MMRNKKIFTFLILYIFNSFDAFAQKKIDYSASKYDDEFAAYDEEFNNNNQSQVYDPFESVNRKIFKFNDSLDRHLLEPIARGYHNSVPNFIRDSLKNIVTNLTLPLSCINSFAQGKVDNGLATFSNFLINSTIGVAGIFDVAAKKNIKYEHEDFGQTLAHYGTKSGPYLVIPVFGPSNIRDFSGFAITSAIDPMSFNALEFGGSADAINVEYRYANNIIYYLGIRENLLNPIDDMRHDSFDLYAAFRSVYTQQRDAQIKK